MQWMTGNGDRRTHVLLGQHLLRRAARIGFLGSLFGLTHACAPRAAIKNQGRHPRNAAAGDAHTMLQLIPGSDIDPTQHRRRAFLLLASLCALSGCGERPFSTLDAAGPAAAPIATLWWTMFAGATALFMLVMGLLWLAYHRPGFASNTSPRTWLLGGGVLMPAAVLAILAGYALYLGERLIARSDSQVVQVQAVALMWDWQFHYPQMEAATSTPVLHIPAGVPVEMIVTSRDVIHSFWIPRLAGKIDAIPGHETRIRLQADSPGEYEGQCAEFCGIGHTTMQFKVVAHETDAYRAAVLRDSQ